MDIVLASASPRRRELLRMLGVENLKIIPAKGGEHIEPGWGPAETVRNLSRDKALEVAGGISGEAVIIAADTVVALDGKILGKPRDEKEAVEMLSGLSGRTHEVYTGVTVIKGGDMMTEHERTAVRFREVTGDEIRAYVATGEPMDKAGAYGAQGIGSLFVEGVEGDFYNVVGLPMCRLALMLKKLKVDLL